MLRIAPATARVPYKLLIANKCISLAGNFDGHGDAPVQYQAHQHMRRAQRFNLSHWTPQSVKYSLRIAPATARVPYKKTKRMHLTRWQFQWPWRCASMVPSALTHALCSALQFKPLDTVIGRIFALITPATARVPYKQAKNTIKTNASHLLAILMAKAMRRYSTKHIDRFVILGASIEATGHRNWSNICSVSPRRPPGSHTSRQKNTIKRQNKHRDLRT